MIKITSFYPFSGWLKMTQEFYDDKFVVRTKSLTFEREDEYVYNKVAAISHSYHSSNSQMLFGFGLLVAINFALAFFCTPIYANPALLRTAQVLFIGGALLFVASFIKTFHLVILDEDGNALTSIKLTRRNHEATTQITELIKSKSKNIQEISVTDPSPETMPAFEHTYYDISRLEKTTDRFYEDKIIGFEKGMFSKRVYTVKYNELSGNLFRAATGTNLFGGVFTIAAFIFFALGGLYWGFNILSRIVYSYAFYTFLTVLAISFLMQFVKRSVIGLYGKSEQTSYWAYVNRAEKEKFEKIIEFVQSRIPAENKEASPKETE